MNKNIRILYNITQQLNNQYNLYDKYGLGTNLQSLHSEPLKNKNFIITTKQTTFLNSISKSNQVFPILNSKYKSFVSERPTISFDKSLVTTLNENTINEDINFGLSTHKNLYWSLSKNLFTFKSLLVDNASIKSFKLPRDFTNDFKNLEDWSSIQNRPDDVLVRENFTELEASLEKNITESQQNNLNLTTENLQSSWTSNSETFFEFYKNKISGEAFTSTKKFQTKVPEKLTLLEEFTSLLKSTLFSQGNKNNTLVEQVISDDIQSIYKNRLDTEKKLRWFYGLLTKSAFNRLIHPFKTNRSLSSKKGIGSNVLNSLETRLDVQIFRMRWAPTITAARQLIQHNHILVWSSKNYSDINSGRCPEKKISNYVLQEGDIIMLKPQSFNILLNYWNIHDEAITENNISESFSYKFPWYVFQNNSVLELLTKRWSQEECFSTKKETLFTLKSNSGSLNLSKSLDDKLVDFIDYNLRNNKSNLEFNFIETPITANNLPSHLECHPSLLFHTYRKKPNLSTIKFPQLDANQLKAFLFSHN